MHTGLHLTQLSLFFAFVYLPRSPPYLFTNINLGMGRYQNFNFYATTSTRYWCPVYSEREKKNFKFSPVCKVH